MKTYLDCYACFVRQALEAARMTGANEMTQKTVLLRVLDVLQDAELDSTPPEISQRVHQIVKEETAVDDPYRKIKEQSTREAWKLYSWLADLVAETNDPLETAVRLSIAGNIIDMGPNVEYELRDEVERVLQEPLVVDEMASLRDGLGKASRVLYLADNAGETVFDRLLIETLDVPVTYAVKGAPIINDATLADARDAGVDEVAEVVSTGSAAPGTIREACSERFRRTLAGAELVIAKGQANYETLSDEGPRTFFLLQTKCPIIAREVGVPLRSIIVHQGRDGGRHGTLQEEGQR